MRRHFKSVRICRGDLKSAFATFAAIDPFRRPKIKAVIRQYRVRSCEFGWHAASLQQGSTQDSLMLLPMRSLLKKIQSVYLTPWSLKTVIKRDEAEWFGQNATRRRLSLSRLVVRLEGGRTDFTLLHYLDHPGDTGGAGVPDRDLLRRGVPAASTGRRGVRPPLHARLGGACGGPFLLDPCGGDGGAVHDAEHLGNRVPAWLGVDRYGLVCSKCRADDLFPFPNGRVPPARGAGHCHPEIHRERGAAQRCAALERVPCAGRKQFEGLVSGSFICR